MARCALDAVCIFRGAQPGQCQGFRTLHARTGRLESATREASSSARRTYSGPPKNVPEQTCGGAQIPRRKHPSKLSYGPHGIDARLARMLGLMILWALTILLAVAAYRGEGARARFVRKALDTPWIGPCPPVTV